MISTNSIPVQDIWYEILPFVLESPTDFNKLSRVSKFFNAITPKCIPDEYLADKFARYNPHKINLLSSKFLKSPPFISLLVIRGFPLDWNIVLICEEKDRNWLEIVKCNVAAHSLFKPDVAYELPERIRTDEKLMQEVVKTKDRVLRKYEWTAGDYQDMSSVEASHFPYELRLEKLKQGLGTNNPSFVYISVAFHCDNALEYASSDLKMNKKFLQACLTWNGPALQYIPHMQNDEELVLVALRSNVQSLLYAGQILKSNPEFWLKAVKIDVEALKYAPPIILNDSDFMLQAMVINPVTIEYSGTALCLNLEYIKEALQITQYPHNKLPTLMRDVVQTSTLDYSEVTL